MDMECVKSQILKTEAVPKPNLAGSALILMMGNDPTAKMMFMADRVTPYVKAVRRAYSTAFSGINLRNSLPKVNVVIDGMMGIIEANRKQGAIDLQELCVKMTLDAIGLVAFDSNLGGLDGTGKLYPLLIETGYIVRDRFINPFKRIYCSLFPNSGVVKRENEVIDALTSEWTKLAEEILLREDPPEGEEPIWSSLRKLMDADSGEALKFKDLRAELTTVVIGGMDTTGHQLSWILALLASYPRVTTALLEQLKMAGLCGERARDVTFDDIGKLPYLTAIIKEGMRVAAVAPAVLREVPYDMTILGYRIPKGTLLPIPGNRSLDSDEEWGDPHVFRPERWLTEKDISQKYYLGFSYGPRDCIGQRLATMEMRVAIIRLLREYHFDLTVSFDELMKSSRNGLVIRAEHGMRFNVTPRKELKAQ